jgi:hypothetical protein
MNWDSESKERMGKEIAEGIALKIAKGFAIGFGMLFFFLFFGFLLAWVIKFLWNATLVPLFEWRSISYWQAMGLLILAKIFFGFGIGGGSGKNHWKESAKRNEQGRHPWWKSDDAKLEGELSATRDEAFKKYWREEGRAAYEAYMASRKDEKESKQ